ncbi:MAG: hypothetical protein A3E78_11765 [Alphaproteobacteria bacterium RIFCSPHIGHO2_12_FULL_63_12]|nr:MAG: hypothetical protein A3E78_11765 [Alphaproteobacteria bacterium RIFCSPHIGHO2_12_FULL_63_12]
MNSAGPRRHGGTPKKYHLTDERRELIVRLYDGCNRSSLAARLGVPDWVVTRWARQLGVARTKEPRWTPEDLDYLERGISRHSWAAMAKHLRRSKIAVQLKAKRLGLRKLSTEGLTQNQVAFAFGVERRKVHRWIQMEWLRARRRRSDRTAANGGDAYLIFEADLRRFIAMHPDEIELRRIADKQWFIDLLVGAIEPEKLVAKSVVERASEAA